MPQWLRDEATRFSNHQSRQREEGGMGGGRGGPRGGGGGGGGGSGCFKCGQEVRMVRSEFYSWTLLTLILVQISANLKSS